MALYQHYITLVLHLDIINNTLHLYYIIRITLTVHLALHFHSARYIILVLHFGINYIIITLITL